MWGMLSAECVRLPPRLVSVVKFVVHEPRDYAGFPNGLVAQENLRLHIIVQPTVGSGLADPEIRPKRRTSLYFARGDTVAPLAIAPAALPRSPLLFLSLPSGLVLPKRKELYSATTPVRFSGSGRGG